MTREFVAEVAPAKVNLFLHVGPTRADGLHELASLFVFAADGDVVEAEPADGLHLAVTGPFAAALKPFPVESNLVWRAALALQSACGVRRGAALTLRKRLPVAAGVGGGSSDAAAALRALVRLWELDVSPHLLRRIAFRLGADVPACLSAAPVYVGGAGERIMPGPKLPPLWLCLVNPRVETPTGPVFRAFDAAHPSPLSPSLPRVTRLATPTDVAAYLEATRNDLEPFAVRRKSVIGAARDFVAECSGARLARMSGSGATVFGLFADGAGASRAAQAAKAKGWWASPTRVSAGAESEFGG